MCSIKYMEFLTGEKMNTKMHARHNSVKKGLENNQMWVIISSMKWKCSEVSTIETCRTSRNNKLACHMSKGNYFYKYIIPLTICLAQASYTSSWVVFGGRTRSNT